MRKYNMIPISQNLISLPFVKSVFKCSEPITEIGCHNILEFLFLKTSRITLLLEICHCYVN
jgi:hypothetical protein